MASSFLLTLRFLAPEYHGRRDGGEPEWPPSPLRVYQALLAAAVARSPARTLGQEDLAALRWLEELPPPRILAPRGLPAMGRRLSVPNNAMDVVGRLWAHGSDSTTGDASPATHRTMKTVRPTLLQGDACVHLLWLLGEHLDSAVVEHADRLAAVATSIVVIGWGVDLVVGEARLVDEVAVASLAGELWEPQARAGADGLRVPVSGTLEALCERYRAVCRRISPDGLLPTPPLTRYTTVTYRRAGDRPPRPAVVFALHDPDADRLRPFDAARQGLTVAGMMRHAVDQAAKATGWSAEKIATVVLGHGEQHGEPESIPAGSQRFSYLPVPTIEARGGGPGVVGAIRRVLLTCLGGDCARELNWAREALVAGELIDETSRQVKALLGVAPPGDTVVRRYLGSSTTWATVTPVSLPGHDDPKGWRRRLRAGVTAQEQQLLLARLDARVDRLLRKAILQAGFSAELAEHAELSWRATGFLPGVERIDCYGLPGHLRGYRRLHVRLVWRDARGEKLSLPGPLCLGGGRFLGLGLFATLPE